MSLKKSFTQSDLLGSQSQEQTRRSFLSTTRMGFASLAMGAMLAKDGIVRADAVADWQPPNGIPHQTPKAKSVIWLFMNGGVSQAESFDPKPELSK